MRGSRLKENEILDNFKRGSILVYIRVNPGTRQRDIKKAFGIRYTSMTYHLSVLKQYGLVKSYIDEKTGFLCYIDALRPLPETEVPQEQQFMLPPAYQPRREATMATA